MKRVLIIRSGAVGDLILTLPVLSALKNHYDGLSIDMMGDPTRLALLKQCGHVDDVLSIDGRDANALFAPETVPSDSHVLRDPPGHMIQRLNSYDAILSYLPDPGGVFTTNFRRYASGPVLTGRSRPTEGDRVHMTRVLMDALKPLGIETPVDPPRVDVPLSAASDDLRRMETDRMLVAIHPGSGGAEKCWPAENYAALIECLVERGYRPVVTFGPADDEVRRLILPRIKGRNVMIAEGLPLADMAAMFARCQAMIGNDSGMTHLAAAAGAPVVALFGPTDPAVWGPRGKEVRILWGNENIERDVDLLNWQGPFRPRSLVDSEAMRPDRIAMRVDATAGTA